MGGAVLVWAAFVGLMELQLAHRRVLPTLVDSESLWIRQRVLASRLQERALVLIGTSRIQLAADLEVLRARSGLEPVQLAVDGSSFVPILEGFAADGVKILWAKKHGNKLRSGHLRGNKFRVRVRETESVRASAVADELRQHIRVPFLRVCEAFQDQNTGAFRENKAVAVPVERPRRFLREVIARRKCRE